MEVSGALLAVTIAMFGIMLMFKDKVDKYHKNMKEEHVQKIKNHVNSQKIASYIEIGVIVSFVGVLASFAGIGAWVLRR